jgi:hypothetical protein
MDQSGVKEYIPILESIMRISLAGFGGAMAGLSLSRRAALARTANSVLTKNINKTATIKKHVINRHHPLATRTGDGTSYAVDRELPAAWAMACMTFTGVIEFTRFASPSGFAIDLASKLSADEEKQTNDTNDIDGGEDVNLNDATEQSAKFSVPIDLSWLSEPATQTTIKTIADYTIGGALGGALFAGSAVRTSAGRKIDAAILGTATRTGGPLAGLLPGAGLGLLAGVTIVTVDYVRERLEEQFGEEDEQLDELPQESNNIEAASSNTETIPAHIKSMSNEELAKAIQDIKR